MSEPTKNPYQDTLNLPQTEFSLRAHAATKEPEILAYWEEAQVHQASSACNKGKESFILHDGPPYANGHIHSGHALNKILKDIVVKSKRMAGYYAPYVPGWDCHGLPIEIKVSHELGMEKQREKSAEDRTRLKKACRTYAQQWLEVQRKEFKALGILGDWDNPYITMSPEYEADIMRAFATFVEKGFIERKGKTVPWCFSCQTVLATAEIEYQDRKDPSTYILFDLDQQTYRYTFPFLYEQRPELTVGFLVWTTTPWTIPLNRAVVLHPDTVYVLLQGKDENQAFMVAQNLADQVCQTLGIEKKELAECDAQLFAPRIKDGKKQYVKVNHPQIDGFQVPILLDDMVVVTDGTACLHSAPGCGPEDYMLALRHGIEVFSPLSSDGRYTKGIFPPELEGMSILDGQIWSLKTLAQRGRLIHKQSIKHAYPHCWRCHNGLMFRATDQWFCDLKKHDLVDNALKELQTVSFYPAWGKSRLEAFVGNRVEWCISRQRVWGVPITALICVPCDLAWLDADFIRSVADKVAQEGIEFWDTITLQELAHQGILKKGFACTSCGNSDLSAFRKEQDILDVWFDSGVSSNAVVAQDPRLGLPADMYLEGSDQHRGWFQSSLLCGMVLNEQTPTKSFLTHGYVVDKDHRKMSKSLGNVVGPEEIIGSYSRDILRLWVASVDAEGDVVISDALLKNIAETYRKIRNSCRFMISNLYDFNVTQDAVSYGDMLALDQYILMKLNDLQAKVKKDYATYNFPGVIHSLNNFCVNDLSALYLDISKDRLYCEKPESLMRRSAQTALYHILDTFTPLMAPVLSFLAEEVSGYYLKNNKTTSIHLASFRAPLFKEEIAKTTAVTQEPWQLLELIRDEVLLALEKLRKEGTIRHSLEAQVVLHMDASEEQASLAHFFEHFTQHEGTNRFLQDWFIVSQVTIASDSKTLKETTFPWLHLVVSHADGVKCPRCWQWDDTDECCKRCKSVL